MKKTIKKIMSVSLAVVMLAGLASCSSGNKGGTVRKGFIANDSADGKSTYYTTEDGKLVVVMTSSVTQDSTEEDKANFELTKQKFAEKFPEYHIEWVTTPGGTDYRSQYDKDLMAGNAPDVFEQFSYTDIPTRIENGTIAEITDLVNEWDLKKEDLVLDTFDNAISKDGKWYAIPRSAYVQANLYNVKALGALGEDVNNLPKSWDEFAELGKRVTDVNVPRLGYELMGMDWCAWPFTVWVWSAGGEMVKENGDGTWSIAFNEEPGVDAAEFLNKCVWEHGITQKNILADMTELTKDVVSGTAMSAFFALDNIINKKNIEDYGVAMEDYRMTTLPTKDGSAGVALAGGEVITFNPQAAPETIKAAFEIITYKYYDEELLRESWKKNAEKGNINIQQTPRTDLWEEKLTTFGINQENIDAMIEMRENSKPEPYCPHWSELKSELAPYLQEIFLGNGMTREQMKAKLDECAQKLYSTYPDVFVQK